MAEFTGISGISGSAGFASESSRIGEKYPVSGSPVGEGMTAMIAHPIADMLTRIRNANAKAHGEVLIPHSRTKEAIARVLKQEGYIVDYKVLDNQPQDILRIELKFKGERGNVVGAITKIKLVSKPSRRFYVGKDGIGSPAGGLGVFIVSTSQGILSGNEARQRGIGGEVLCEVL